MVGRVAAGRQVGKTVALRAAAYRGWRLPTLNELYRPFRAGADATAANGALDPERLRGLEAGVDWVPIEGAKLSATTFANRLSGAITNVTVGKGPGTYPGVGFVAAGGVYTGCVRMSCDCQPRDRAGRAFRARALARGSKLAFTDARLDASGAAPSSTASGRRKLRGNYASASLGWKRAS